MRKRREHLSARDIVLLTACCVYIAAGDFFSRFIVEEARSTSARHSSRPRCGISRSGAARQCAGGEPRARRKARNRKLAPRHLRIIVIIRGDCRTVIVLDRARRRRTRAAAEAGLWKLGCALSASSYTDAILFFFSALCVPLLQMHYSYI